MLKRSNWENVKTWPSSDQSLLTDVELDSAEWEFFATEITVTLLHSHQGGFYYVLWSMSDDFSENVYRSRAIEVPADAAIGQLLTKTLLGFAPDSTWNFKAVWNPDRIRGEQ